MNEKINEIRKLKRTHCSAGPILCIQPGRCIAKVWITLCCFHRQANCSDGPGAFTALNVMCILSNFLVSTCPPYHQSAAMMQVQLCVVRFVRARPGFRNRRKSVGMENWHSMLHSWFDESVDAGKQTLPST